MERRFEVIRPSKDARARIQGKFDTITLRVLLAVLLGLFAQASNARADEVERLRVRGSDTMAVNLVPAVVESWLHDIGYNDIRRQSRNRAVLEVHATRDGLPVVVEITGKGPRRASMR
ncbi:hypothetical protein ACFFGH_14560 [Lysobacter korlensis]|uniref:Uncharacterized protein n=1 Tax=Lysobacter korlensis TaxID=553636 RepID=A0ABV6RRP3_9GAMM